jgi:hypothetical protein
VLIIFDMQASASFGSRLSKLFTGAPSDRTIWPVVAYLDARVRPSHGVVIHEAVSWRARRLGAAPLASCPHQRP